MPVGRNLMVIVIVALAIALGVVGYQLYQAKKMPDGVQINIGPSGVSIQNK